MRRTAALIRLFSIAMALAFSFSITAYAATPDPAPGQPQHVPSDFGAAGAAEDDGVASVDTALEDEDEQADEFTSGTPEWLEELLTSLLGDVLDPETLALLLAIIAEHQDNSGPGNAFDDERLNPGQSGKDRGRDEDEGQSAGQNDPTGDGPDDEDGDTVEDEETGVTVDEPTAEDEDADEESAESVDEPTADDEDTAGDEETADEDLDEDTAGDEDEASVDDDESDDENDDEDDD